MPFLYGGHIVKAHVGKWSEDCPEHSGVVILSMDDTPLGFGVTARSTAESRKLEPTSIVAFRQGDVGEYLREVRHCFALLCIAFFMHGGILTGFIGRYFVHDLMRLMCGTMSRSGSYYGP